MRSYEDVPLPFGKHKGELVADIPNSYLEWLSGQEFVEDKFPKLFDIVNQEIAYRERFGIVI